MENVERRDTSPLRGIGRFLSTAGRLGAHASKAALARATVRHLARSMHLRRSAPALRVLAAAVLVLSSLPLAVLAPPGSLLAPRPAQAAVGDLDPTFGTGGKVITPMAAGNDSAGAMVIQPNDGKIVVAGNAAVNGGDFALARYCPDGRLDDGVNCGLPGFGTGGKVTTTFGTGDDGAQGLALQPDGKLVAAGYTTGTGTDTARSFALARYLANGSPDPAFGAGGKATTSLSAFGSEAYSIVLQADGKIVAAGYSRTGSGPSDYDFAVVRYCTDGRLDDGLTCGAPGFGTGGIVTTAVTVGYRDIAYEVVIQPLDGMIIAAGQTTYYPGGFPSLYALVRYTPDGAQDTTFGSGGKVTTTPTPSHGVAFTAALQPDGANPPKIVVAGSSWSNSSQWDFSLARYCTDGRLDNGSNCGAGGFGTGGQVTTPVSSLYDSISALAVQPDGKVLAAGYAVVSGTGDNFALVRYHPNGSLDTTFGAGGKVITQLSTGTDVAGAVALQPGDGKIVVAGYSWNGADYDFAVVRYLGAVPAVLSYSMSVQTVAVCVQITAPNPATIDYGPLALSGSAVSSQIVTSNCGSEPENLLVQGANATAAVTGESAWTLGAAPGANTYVHGFGAASAGSFTALTTSPATLAANLAASATLSFYTQVRAPTSTTGNGSRNTTVTITAVAP